MRKTNTVRADAAGEKDVHDVAKELEGVIGAHEQRKADAKAKADDDAASTGATLAQILAGLTALSGRLDAIEGKDAPKAPEPSLKEQEQPVSADSVERQGLVKAQIAADAVASAHGQRAPQPQVGENVERYRRRMLLEFLPHSKDFRDFDVSKISGKEFDLIETRVYADAIAASNSPYVAGDMLIERVTTDASGRRISTFYGEPRTWMEQFMAPLQRVTKINTGRRDD